MTLSLTERLTALHHECLEISRRCQEQMIGSIERANSDATKWKLHADAVGEAAAHFAALPLRRRYFCDGGSGPCEECQGSCGRHTGLEAS